MVTAGDTTSSTDALDLLTTFVYQDNRKALFQQRAHIGVVARSEGKGLTKSCRNLAEIELAISGLVAPLSKITNVSFI